MIGETWMLIGVLALVFGALVAIAALSNRGSLNSIKNKTAVVDNTLCVGCGVCEQLCPVDAFEHTEGAC